MDWLYAPSSRSKRPLCREWTSYVDDQSIKTGRAPDGTWMSDEERDERVRIATRAADRSAAQSAQEVLEAQGLLPHGLGAEVRKTGDRAKQNPTTGAFALVQK